MSIQLIWSISGTHVYSVTNYKCNCPGIIRHSRQTVRSRVTSYKRGIMAKPSGPLIIHESKLVPEHGGLFLLQTR